jgi:outer membrane protein
MQFKHAVIVACSCMLANNIYSQTIIAQADQAEPTAQIQTKNLSLAEIFSISQIYNSEYLANIPLKDASIQRLKQAKGALLPQVNIAANQQYGYNNYHAIAGSSGHLNNISLNASQTLYKKDKNINIEQANLAVQITQIQINIAQNELANKCIDAYFAILSSKDIIKTIEVQQHNIKQQLQFAKKSFDAGLATITDTHEAQAKLDKVSAEQIAAQNELNNKINDLQILIGENPKISMLSLNVDTNMLEKVKRSNIEFNNNNNNNNSTNLNIQLAELKIKIAKQELEKAKALDYPSIELVASIANTNNGVRSFQSNKSASIGVNFNMPIFAGYSISAKQQEEIFNIRKAEIDKKSMIRTLENQAQRLKNNIDSLSSQYSALESAYKSAGISLKSNKLGYKVGVRINIDVLNAQDQVFEIEKNLNKTKYDIMSASLKYKTLFKLINTQDIDTILTSPAI